MEYEFTEEQEIAADKAASRLTEGGGYIGKFTRAEAVVSGQKGTHGIAFTFDVPGSGACEFTLWTMSADGKILFGGNFVAAMAKLMNVPKVKSVPGKVLQWNETTNEREEVDGEVFECLCNKPIGVVLLKELYTDQKGIDRERLGLIGVYHAETRLTASEIKEKKVKPEKYMRLLKQAEKPKDQRKKSSNPAQPGMGANFDDVGY